MRQTLTLLLLLAVVGLGVVLYLNTRESRTFNLSTAIQTPVQQQAQTIATTTSLTTVSASNLLEKPRYTGQNTKGQRWEITATSAAQQGTAASTSVVLNDVSATLETPNSPQPLTLAARSGTYVQQQNLLELKDDITFTGTAGKWAFNVRANRLTANHETAEFTLTGGVKAKLTPTH